MSEQRSKKLGQEELRRIIELCRSIENTGLNPFLVDVDDLIAIIKEYYKNWDNSEELCLDAEALNKIASIIKMQNEWIKQRATSLYRDPFLVLEKLKSLPIEKIVRVFSKAWHPIIELEQISLHSLARALKYWDALIPLNERWKKEDILIKDTVMMTRDELIKQGILLDENFSSELERLWINLKDRADKDGKIKYWDFIGAETYSETMNRAYLTSFLITYGYATLEINPIEEKIFIKPCLNQVSIENANLFSFPITLSFEVWKQWKAGQEV